MSFYHRDICCLLFSQRPLAFGWPNAPGEQRATFHKWHALGPRVEIRLWCQIRPYRILIPNSLVVVTYQLTMSVPQAELRKVTASPLILMNVGSRLAKTNPFAIIAQNCIAVVDMCTRFQCSRKTSKGNDLPLSRDRQDRPELRPPTTAPLSLRRSSNSLWQL